MEKEVKRIVKNEVEMTKKHILQINTYGKLNIKSCQ